MSVPRGSAELWALGDYPAIADRFADVAGDLVAAACCTDADVLDVATGAGAVAIEAVRAGGRATGLDVTPELLTAAATRAEAAGVEVRWVRADMTAMPEPDAGYDRVLSSFGAMFAPDPPAMVAELLRVCRPGGLVALTAWTPDGVFGRTPELYGRFLPPELAPGPGFERWGDPRWVGELFTAAGAVPTTQRRTTRLRWNSLAEAVPDFERSTPGAVAVHRMIAESTGRSAEASAAVHELFAEYGAETSDGFVLDADYLVVIAQRPS